MMHNNALFKTLTLTLTAKVLQSTAASHLNSMREWEGGMHIFVGSGFKILRCRCMYSVGSHQLIVDMNKFQSCIHSYHSLQSRCAFTRTAHDNLKICTTPMVWCGAEGSSVRCGHLEQVILMTHLVSPLRWERRGFVSQSCQGLHGHFRTGTESMQILLIGNSWATHRIIRVVVVVFGCLCFMVVEIQAWHLGMGVGWGVIVAVGRGIAVEVAIANGFAAAETLVACLWARDVCLLGIAGYGPAGRRAGIWCVRDELGSFLFGRACQFLHQFHEVGARCLEDGGGYLLRGPLALLLLGGALTRFYSHGVSDDIVPASHGFWGCVRLKRYVRAPTEFLSSVSRRGECDWLLLRWSQKCSSKFEFKRFRNGMVVEL